MVDAATTGGVSAGMGSKEGVRPMDTHGRRAWPAAKYLTYGFWRSWILIVYTAPIWSYLTHAPVAGVPSSQMYVWSTLAFSAVSIALGVLHRAEQRWLTNRWVMLAAGVLASVGVVLEYGACLWLGGAVNLLFVAGAVLTGLGTACIAVRAGMIYARAFAATAVANTALSEVAAGLLFFFVIGTLPEVALLVAAGLPLLAALMVWLDGPEPADSFGERADSGALTPSALVPFVRFMVAVFVLTCVASLIKGMFDSHDGLGLSLESGVLGITVTILVSFGLSLVASCARSFNVSVIYYPLVLVLAVGVVLVFALGGYNIYAGAITVFVYSMFSLFMWCLLSFIARGDYWSPLQVFGWGRGVFALGSLAGHYVGTRFDAFGDTAAVQPLVVGVVLAFLVIASGMLVFREGDVRRVVNAAWLSEELRRERGEQPQGAAAVPVVSGGALSAEEFALEHNLTSREREVFALMLEGRDARSIGGALVISENTAKSHIRSIYAKVGVHTRQEFVDAVHSVER